MRWRSSWPFCSTIPTSFGMTNVSGFGAGSVVASGATVAAGALVCAAVTRGTGGDVGAGTVTITVLTAAGAACEPEVPQAASVSPAARTTPRVSFLTSTSSRQMPTWRRRYERPFSFRTPYNLQPWEVATEQPAPGTLVTDNERIHLTVCSS